MKRVERTMARGLGIALMLAATGCDDGDAPAGDAGGVDAGGVRRDANLPGDAAIVRTPRMVPAMTDPNGNVDDPSACLTECRAESDEADVIYCGSDRQNYEGCLWECGLVPDEVDVVPGACQADGSPQPGGPPYPADGEEICDWLLVGNEWKAIECSRTIADSALPANVVMSGMPAMMVSPTVPTDTIQTSVDHRNRFRDAMNASVVKDQGPVGSCTAFATTAAMESAIAAATGTYTPLSELNLWLRYCAADTSEALTQAYTPIATEAHARTLGFPYDGNNPMGLARACEREGEADRPPPPAARAATAMLDANAAFQVTAVQRLQRPNDATVPTAAQIQQALNDGNDVVITVRMRSADWNGETCLQTGVNRPIPCPPGATPRARGGVIPFDVGALQAGGAHAVLVVGYEMRTPPGGTSQLYFIFRNSWGSSWGDGGYGYLPATYVAQNGLNPFFAIQVRARTATMPTMSCPMGQAQSLLDNQCHVVCSDGSLQNAAGMCPAPGSCMGTGLVRVNGTCVRACNAGLIPTARVGMITVQTGSGCEPAGCTYQLGGLAPFTVNQHCPAPNCGINANAECVTPTTL